METSVENMKITAAHQAKIIFASTAARTLLNSHLKSLHEPDTANWKIVKDNVSRTVYKGSLGGVDLFLKHFHEETFTHRLTRKLGVSRAKSEMRYSLYLSRNGVKTPTPLACCPSGEVQWFATESALPCTQGDIWHERMLRDGNTRDIETALGTLAKMIAQMHRIGIIHQDLHTGNILVKSPDDLILTDLHRIKRHRRLSRRKCAKNLAQLMHDRFDFTTRTQRLRFLKTYIKVVDVKGSLRGWEYLVSFFARKHRLSQFAKRDRRILKSNRYFTKIKLPNRWSARVILASKHSPPQSKAAGLAFTESQWAQILRNPRELLEGPDITVIKSSGSGKVIRRMLNVAGQGIDVYIKNPRRKKKWKVIFDCFRRSRPIRAFISGHQLLTRGIYTALPIAALERKVGPFVLDSMLITESVQAVQLNQFLNRNIAVKLDKRIADLDIERQQKLVQTCLSSLGKTVRRLHDVNFSHRDLKSVNILVPWAGEEHVDVVLIDLDGLKRVNRPTDQRRFQGLMRLNVSLLEIPEISHQGRLRMLLGYLRHPGSGRINFKPYWYMLQNWSAKKLSQQIRSRRKKQKAKGGFA